MINNSNCAKQLSYHCSIVDSVDKMRLLYVAWLTEGYIQQLIDMTVMMHYSMKQCHIPFFSINEASKES